MLSSAQGQNIYLTKFIPGAPGTVRYSQKKMKVTFFGGRFVPTSNFQRSLTLCQQDRKGLEQQPHQRGQYYPRPTTQRKKLLQRGAKKNFMTHEKGAKLCSELKAAYVVVDQKYLS